MVSPCNRTLLERPDVVLKLSYKCSGVWCGIFFSTQRHEPAPKPIGPL